MKTEKRRTGSQAREKDSSVIFHRPCSPFAVGLVTCSSRAEARKIARAILTRKLAACVNIVNGLESHYWWQGKLESARESLLLIKTTRAREQAVMNAVKAAHSYEVPEVIFVPITAGESKYLKWVGASVKGRTSC